jgi:hypothetical protein
MIRGKILMNAQGKEGFFPSYFLLEWPMLLCEIFDLAWLFLLGGSSTTYLHGKDLGSEQFNVVMFEKV